MIPKRIQSWLDIEEPEDLQFPFEIRISAIVPADTICTVLGEKPSETILYVPHEFDRAAIRSLWRTMPEKDRRSYNHQMRFAESVEKMAALMRNADFN